MQTITPAEFEVMIVGALERERVHRYGFASVVATIRSALGDPTMPEELLGEVEINFRGDDSDGLFKPSPAEMLQARDAMYSRKRAEAEERQRRWISQYEVEP